MVKDVLTLSSHVHRETLLETASLTLVPPRHIDDAHPSFLAGIMKVPTDAPLEKSSAAVA